MRKRSLSVACERADQLSHLANKFEGVPSDHEEESESEEENDEATENVDSDWAESDYRALMKQLRSVLPQKDSRRYQSTLKKIDWERVAFEGHTSDEVKAVTLRLVGKIRKYRTLSEVIEDIPLQLKKTCSIGKPKKFLSAYNFFMKAKYAHFKEKHPELPTKSLFKVIHHEYSVLSQKKKQKYEALAAEAKEVHKQQMEKYYKDNPKASAAKKKATKRSQANTPFALFQEERLNEREDLTVAELREEWNMLEVKKKFKYIQRAFKSQSENSKKPLKLTKEEQIVVDHINGKPMPIPRSLAAYYAQNYANTSNSGTLNSWRREKLAEFKSLPKLRKLQLEIEYRQAKQNYVTSYENYIANLTDKETQQAEIEQLKTFIEKKLDKADRQQLPDDTRPFSSMVHAAQLENEMIALPIAESTVLMPKTKKSKKTAAPEQSIIVESPQRKPLKSILKTPDNATTAKAAKNNAPEFVEPAVPPKSKRKHSVSETDSDSNTEKRSKASIVRVPIVEPNGKQSSTKQNGTTTAAFSKTNEPVRPPTTILEFYKQKYYLGKEENCAESFKKLSTNRKETLREEMREAQKKYFKELQKFLKNVPQQHIKKYLGKIRQVKIDFAIEDKTLDESGLVVEAGAKTTPKKEPETSSGSGSSSNDEENSGDENTQNGADDDDDESSDDE